MGSACNHSLGVPNWSWSRRVTRSCRWVLRAITVWGCQTGAGQDASPGAAGGFCVQSQSGGARLELVKTRHQELQVGSACNHNPGVPNWSWSRRVTRSCRWVLRAITIRGCQTGAGQDASPGAAGGFCVQSQSGGARLELVKTRHQELQVGSACNHKLRVPDWSWSRRVTRSCRWGLRAITNWGCQTGAGQDASPGAAGGVCLQSQSGGARLELVKTCHQELQVGSACNHKLGVPNWSWSRRVTRSCRWGLPAITIWGCQIGAGQDASPGAAGGVCLQYHTHLAASLLSCRATEAIPPQILLGMVHI